MCKLPDSEIEQWVLKGISLNGAGRAREICVVSEGGVVTLKGTVNSFDKKLAVMQAAEIANGVVSVVDEIRVELIAKPLLNTVSDISSVRRRRRLRRPHRSVNLPVRARRKA